MDLVLSTANCGSCSSEDTVIPINIDQDSGDITWQCTGCGTEYFK